MPPLTGVAVKVTEEPEQIEADEAAIVTAGVADVLSVIVIALLVAVGVVAQPELLVKTTVTTSLLFKEEDVNVLLLVPALVPFTFH